MSRRVNGRTQLLVAIVFVGVLGLVGLSLRDSAGDAAIAPATTSALSVEVTGVPDYIYVGTQVALNLEYANYGTAASGPVLLEADIPANFAVAQASHSGVVSDTKVQWPLESIAAQSGGSVQLTLDALRPRDYSTASFDVPDYTGHAVFDDGFKLWARIISGEGSALLASAVAYTDTGAALPTGIQIVLSPSTASLVAGTTHCLTANVTDFGEEGPPAGFQALEISPIVGAQVNFSVSSVPSIPVPDSGSDITDAEGNAEFCYSSDAAREDEISASVVVSGTEYTDDASAEWFDAGEMILRGRVTYLTGGGVQVGLGGARVEACGGPSDVCKSTLTDNNEGTRGDYEITGLEAGEYEVTVFPPNEDENEQDLNLNTKREIVDVVIGITVYNPSLPDAIGVPDGVSIDPFFLSFWINAPVIFWLDPFTFTADGCPGGTAEFTITLDGDNFPSVVDSMTETADPGGAAGTVIFEVTTPVIFATARPGGGAIHGLVYIDIVFDCPEPDFITPYRFPLYIDPSGVVMDTNDNLIEGATVTLYRSDSASGPFVQVPDESDIMSPSNRANPDETNAVGYFGWDTIAGFYIVRAEAAGCHKPGDEATLYVETDVLPVPPPQLGLELVLQCGETENGTLTLNKTVVPAGDGGRFNLQVNGTDFGDATNIPGGQGSGKRGLTPGSYSVRETAGSDTMLTNYVSSIACVHAGSTTVVASRNGVGPLDVEVPSGVDVVCNFTNVLLPLACRGMTIDKYILGTEGNDTINGTGLRELIYGLGGNDTLNGGAGNDCIVGGPGNDTLNGGAGNDRLLGDGGNDRLNGDSGTDSADGGLDRDACVAESRKDCES